MLPVNRTGAVIETVLDTLNTNTFILCSLQINGKQPPPPSGTHPQHVGGGVMLGGGGYWQYIYVC